MLMLNLTGQPFNKTLFDFLVVDERLVDIGDDVVDYEVRHAVAGLMHYLIMPLHVI